jgi:hypothetical protein
LAAPGRPQASVPRIAWRDEPTFSERFIKYMLERNLRAEADLVDHFFNSSEKRLLDPAVVASASPPQRDRDRIAA